VQAAVLCDAIRHRDNLSTPLLRVFHLFIRELKRKEEAKNKRKDHGVVDEPSLE